MAYPTVAEGPAACLLPPATRMPMCWGAPRVLPTSTLLPLPRRPALWPDAAQRTQQDSQRPSQIWVGSARSACAWICCVCVCTFPAECWYAQQELSALWMKAPQPCLLVCVSACTCVLLLVRALCLNECSLLTSACAAAVRAAGCTRSTGRNGSSPNPHRQTSLVTRAPTQGSSTLRLRCSEAGGQRLHERNSLCHCRTADQEGCSSVSSATRSSFFKRL